MSKEEREAYSFFPLRKNGHKSCHCSITLNIISDMLDFCDLANGWRYIDGRCLKFFDTPLPWFDARRTCQDHQGDLTIYKNYNQMLDLFEIVPCRSVEDTVWIGLSDTVSYHQNCPKYNSIAFTMQEYIQIC